MWTSWPTAIGEVPFEVSLRSGQRDLIDPSVQILEDVVVQLLIIHSFISDCYKNVFIIFLIVNGRKFHYNVESL